MSSAAQRGSLGVWACNRSFPKTGFYMKGSPENRGAGVADPGRFAGRFIQSRLRGFEKDIRICLTPTRALHRSGVTHAYFPALSACCGTLEYMAGLYRGNIRGIGDQHVASWADRFLPQPEYDRDTIRVLFDAFRHPVAHRGIASGVWIDQRPGPTHGHRLTWKVFANARHPTCQIVLEPGYLTKDPPWQCRYTHRVHIYLKSLAADIRRGATSYARAIRVEDDLQANFMRCMEQLYPR